MIVYFVREVEVVPMIEEMGDDQVDELKLLINGGAELIRTPTAPVCFDKEMTHDRRLSYLTTVFGPGIISGREFIPQS